MTPEEFIARWRDNTRRERSASQQHFLELCEMLEVPKPGDPGFPADDYDFDKATQKTSGGSGFSDVWKRGCFAWEYKGDQKSLVAAYVQAKDYAANLDNPPLLIVSDMSEIRIHTNFTNTPSVTYVIKLPDLISVEARRDLRHAFLDPERLKPVETPDTVTENAAASIGALATRLRANGHESRRVAHFLNKLVFCMFAEDIGLLPEYIFSEVMEECSKKSDLFESMMTNLFRAMKDRNGLFGKTAIPWFNGGLFDDDDVLPLGFYEIKDLLAAAQLDWSAVDPSIFGTLFEKGLDPARRKEMASLFDARADAIVTSVTRDLFDSPSDKGVGIHYTDAEKIMKIVERVVLRPLRLEWAAAKGKIDELRIKKENAKSGAAKTRAENDVRDVWLEFRERLSKFRVLDPACGSGNFLYLSLIHLKDFDQSVLREGLKLGLPPDNERVTPDAVIGIEINPYAAELAQVTLWIGEIQWQLENGSGINRRPILDSLPNIQCRDALINPDGTKAEWPDADVIIGNPPFLGSRKLEPVLGKEYVSKLRQAYGRSIPDGADFVCFWFKKANDSLDRTTSRVGLVATNSISGGKSREVLKAVALKNHIFQAWSDEPWTIDGAAVRVAMICFAQPGFETSNYLDDQKVDEIYSDLTGRTGLVGADLTKVQKLPENAKIAFQGIVPRSSINRKDAERLQLPKASFLIDGDRARILLGANGNPNRRPNSDVIVPYLIGDEIVRRPLDRFIVDFHNLSEFEASLYEEAFKHILLVREHRAHMKQKQALELWWRHWNTRPNMRDALAGKRRYIATPRVSKHRIFRWVPHFILPDNMIVAIARDDDTTFGILHSRFHEQWSLRLCTYLGVGNDPRYTPSTTFETFPFPDGLGPNVASAKFTTDQRAQDIAVLSCKLNELRENWLNPKELVGEVICPENGIPVGLHPVSENAKKELKKRTLTKLYNDRPSWLHHLHTELDAAVARAYGWPEDFDDDTAMQKLLELNLSRASG